MCGACQGHGFGPTEGCNSRHSAGSAAGMLCNGSAAAANSCPVAQPCLRGRRGAQLQRDPKYFDRAFPPHLKRHRYMMWVFAPKIIFAFEDKERFISPTRRAMANAPAMRATVDSNDSNGSNGVAVASWATGAAISARTQARVCSVRRPQKDLRNTPLKEAKPRSLRPDQVIVARTLQASAHEGTSCGSLRDARMRAASLFFRVAPFHNSVIEHQ
eukprot:gene24177-biopygen5892